MEKGENMRKLLVVLMITAFALFGCATLGGIKGNQMAKYHPMMISDLEVLVDTTEKLPDASKFVLLGIQEGTDKDGNTYGLAYFLDPGWVYYTQVGGEKIVIAPYMELFKFEVKGTGDQQVFQVFCVAIRWIDENLKERLYLDEAAQTGPATNVLKRGCLPERQIFKVRPEVFNGSALEG